MAERSVFQSIVGQQSLVSAPPETSVREAARAMTRANCGSILILDAHGAILGILTERDLMTRVIAKGLDPVHTPVAEVMTGHPLCVPPETSVAEAVVLMIERGFRHLPVVASGGRIIGVFSIRDAMPRELDTAAAFAEFHQQLNDARG